MIRHDGRLCQTVRLFQTEVVGSKARRIRFVRPARTVRPLRGVVVPPERYWKTSQLRFRP